MSNSPETAGGDSAEPHKAEAHESSQGDHWATTALDEIKTQPPGVLFVDVLKVDLPYIVMLTMAVIGVGLVTFTGESVAWYWELLTPVYCAICIYVGWRHVGTKAEHIKLVWT